MAKTKVVRKGRVVMIYEWINNTWKLSKVTCALLILLGCSGCCAFASSAIISEHKAVLAIIGEAEAEGYNGMLAVGGAIRNRGTLKGVYGLHSYRVTHHLYSHKIYLQAVKAWHDSATNDITHGATGWGNAADVAHFRNSLWFPSVYFTAHIGHHYFYGTDG